MTDSAVLREWIVDHGSGDAYEQIAHLLCELLIRYRLIGETTDNSLAFHLTQEDIADATGLTTVHVNRMLQKLREDGLIDLRGRVLTILDPPGLQRAAKYDSTYLHLARTERRDPQVAGRVGNLVSASPHGVLHEAADKVKSLLGKKAAH